MAQEPTAGPDAVFVYGTLRPGRPRWPVLEPYADPVVNPRDAIVRGRLWDAGHGWPAMTVGYDDVPGIVVPLDPSRSADALARLDVVEGVDRGLFERVRVATTDGTDCWAYLWAGDLLHLAPMKRAW
jgi:gamma-glutamylcyclotransferase (GGCT)/AIG2-like uncharacterized protein YtfP